MFNICTGKKGIGKKSLKLIGIFYLFKRIYLNIVYITTLMKKNFIMTIVYFIRQIKDQVIPLKTLYYIKKFI